MARNKGFPLGIDCGIFGMKGSHFSIAILVLFIFYAISYDITY